MFQDGHKASRGDIRHLRSDARLAAKILSCGAVPEEKMRDLMAAMFDMAVLEMTKVVPNVRNLLALLRVFEVGAKLEQDERKLAIAAEQGVNVNVDVEVGRLPVIEVVVKNREEVQQFSDIRDQLVKTLEQRRLPSNGSE